MPSISEPRSRLQGFVLSSQRYGLLALYFFALFEPCPQSQSGMHSKFLFQMVWPRILSFLLGHDWALWESTRKGGTAERLSLCVVASSGQRNPPSGLPRMASFLKYPFAHLFLALFSRSPGGRHSCGIECGPATTGFWADF